MGVGGETLKKFYEKLYGKNDLRERQARRLLWKTPNSDDGAIISRVFVVVIAKFVSTARKTLRSGKERNRIGRID